MFLGSERKRKQGNRVLVSFVHACGWGTVGRSISVITDKRLYTGMLNYNILCV